jgi:hypothetical protein
VDDLQILPERLRTRPKDQNYHNLVKWIGLEIMMLGGDNRRFAKIAQKYPDELLEAAMQEEAVNVAPLARFYEGDDLTALCSRVIESDQLYAWRILARTRPEMAEMLQDAIVARWWNLSVPCTLGGPSPYFLAEWLREVKNTNPVPIQHCLVKEELSINWSK